MDFFNLENPVEYYLNDPISLSLDSLYEHDLSVFV